MQRFFLIVFLVIFCLLNQACSNSEEMLEISYSKVTQIKDKKESTENLKVILDKDKFILQDKSSLRIVNLVKKQIIRINNDAKTYEIASLYALPLFVQFEMKNRERMVKLLTDKIDSDSYIFYAEHEMGIKSSVALKNQIQFVNQDNSFIAKYKNEIVAKSIFSDFKLSSKYKKSFKSYLVYSTRLHPEIRKEIIRENKLFKELFYVTKILNFVSQTTYQMIGIKKIKNMPFNIPSGYKRVFSANKRLDNLIHRIQDRSKMLSIEQYKRKIKNLIGSKKYLEAFLIMMEYGYQYGIIAPESKDSKLKEALQQNKSIQDVIRLQRSKFSTVKEVDQAVKAVQHLLDKKIEGYHVLYIDIAKQYGAIGDFGRELEFLYKALEINPFMSTALADLGSVYMSRYELGDAFMCCSQVNQIAPNHKMIATCKKLREHGEKAFSQYFN